MRISPKFEVKINKGVMVMPKRDLFKKLVQTSKDGEYNLILKKKKKFRSSQQNKYLWAVPYKIISDDTGYTTDEVHAFLAREFLKDRSGVIETVRSTTDLSTMEFEEYTENIRRWGAETLKLNIPLPNEVSY